MKHDSKNFLDCYKIIIFQINAVLVIFLFIKESWNNHTTVSTKILHRTNVLNIEKAPQYITVISEGPCDTEHRRLMKM